MYKKLIYTILFLILSQTLAYAHGGSELAVLIILFLVSVTFTFLGFVFAIVSTYFAKKWASTSGIIFTSITLPINTLYSVMVWNASELNIYVFSLLLMNIIAVVLLVKRKKA